ncbi:MAG TPA: endolytic transglycosylase MltG, partial [Candidatus Syntrophosphaera thermopropionivorans]|nr:endolytic transglycosylase MltG [Candidatus Syntrophosphaera thermopropionivorans]
MKPIKNLSHYLWMLILAIVLVLVIIVLWNIYAPVKSEEMLIKIKKGDTAATIGEKLEQNGVIRSKFLFRTLAAMRGTDKHLIAGTYTIGGKHNLLQTLKMLEEGNVTAVRVTIPEGFSMYQTLHRLERSGLARYEDLYKEATNPDFVYQLTGFKVKSLEGFLYPDTYAFDPDVTVQEILSIMTRNFFNTLKKAGIDPYTIDNFYDKLILASIVEKESNYPEERQLVAGVIYNRL